MRPRDGLQHAGLWLSILLTGCGSQPTTAPVVLTETVTVEVPVPVKRTPPVVLTDPLVVSMPTLGGVCEGDYSLTRAGVEQMIDAFRSAQERLNQWRAWAQ